MKIKTSLLVAALTAAGLFVSGCQQMGSQQVASQQVASAQQVAQDAGAGATTDTTEKTTTSTTTTKTVVDCSKCGRPGARTSGGIKRSSGNRVGGKRSGGGRGPARVTSTGGQCHTHPAIPGCTNSIRHCHPNGDRPHTHHYSCRGGARPAKVQQIIRPMRPVQPPRVQVQKPQRPVIPSVKGKGIYRGPIQVEQGVMQTYKKN